MFKCKYCGNKTASIMNYNSNWKMFKCKYCGNKTASIMNLLRNKSGGKDGTETKRKMEKTRIKKNTI